MQIPTRNGGPNDSFEVLQMSSHTWGIDGTVFFATMFYACYSLARQHKKYIIYHRLEHTFGQI